MGETGETISHREFASRVILLGTLAAHYPAAALEQLRAVVEGSLAPRWLERDPWKTIAEVQNHLFPASENAPGAGDFGAADYLRNTLENSTDGENSEFIFNGVAWLNDLTEERFNHPFAQLVEQDREVILRQIEQSKAGRNWLSKLLTYLLEALLSDPVYGGNRERIGWQWLEHQPGYPTPPDDKTWYRLAASAHRRLKAR